MKIIPSIAPITNLGTRFGFRNYYFLILFIALSITLATIIVYIDLDCLVILINRIFLLEQVLDIYVRTIASPISVRGISSNHHSTSEYILLEIYFLGTRNRVDIRAKITREVYLVDGLKAKMLLGTNIIGPEKIDIITSKN